MKITSTTILDSFRRDRARGTNDDIDLTLRPAYRALLDKLGNPHVRLPPVFHVAGTNGKGSTCAFLRAMLEAAGRSVHVYTSPHLVRFHERIRIAGQLIEEDRLVELLQKIQKSSVPGSITYFEAATAAAFTAFAEAPADFTIVEVGLGGRLDATNVIANPLASIITRLSLDHREYLGDTIRAIAREKAGIMRRGTPCFIAPQADNEALSEVQSVAAEIEAPLFIGGEDWRTEKTADGFRYTDKNVTLDLPTPALPGEHQFDNAGLAIATLLAVQGTAIKQDMIAAGLRHVEWRARLQKLTDGKLASLLPKDFELWLDGGHNDSAGEVLARQAALWQQQDGKPLHVICGMLMTKNPAEFLTPLRPSIATLQTIPVPDEAGSFTSRDLAKAAEDAGIENVRTADNIEAALQNVISAAASPVRILICGSLYLAGHVLKKNSAAEI